MAEQEKNIRYDSFAVGEGVTVHVPTEVDTHPNPQEPVAQPIINPQATRIRPPRRVPTPQAESSMFPPREHSQTANRRTVRPVPTQALAPTTQPRAMVKTPTTGHSVLVGTGQADPALAVPRKEKGNGLVTGGLAVALAIGAVAAFNLRNGDTASPRALGTETLTTPPALGNAAPVPLTNEALQELQAIEEVVGEPVIIPVENSRAPTSTAAPTTSPTSPNNLPSLVLGAPSASPNSKPSATQSSPNSTTKSPTPSRTTPEKPAVPEVKLPLTPSAGAIEAINSFVNNSNVEGLKQQYSNLDDNLDLERLARRGELNSVSLNAVRHNQEIINAVYAVPGVRTQLGQPAWLTEASLGSMRANGTDPANQLLAHTDNILRNAQGVYPLVGNAIVEAAYINNTLVRRTTESLQRGESVWVPDATNTGVLDVRVVRPGDNTMFALVATFAEYKYDDRVESKVRWTLLQPIDHEGRFVATTVFSKTLDKRAVEETPTTEPTPTDIFTEPTPNTTTTTEDIDRRDDDNDREARKERRKNRNSD